MNPNDCQSCTHKNYHVYNIWCFKEKDEPYFNCVWFIYKPIRKEDQ